MENKPLLFKDLSTEDLVRCIENIKRTICIAESYQKDLPELEAELKYRLGEAK